MTASVRMRDIPPDCDTKTPRGTPRAPTAGFFSFGPPKLFGFKPHVLERERSPPLSKTKLDSPKRIPSSPTPIPRPRPTAERTPRPGRDQSPLTSPRINPSQKAKFFGATPQLPLFPTTPPRDIPPPRISTTDDRPSKYQRKSIVKPSKPRDIEDELTTTLAIDTDDLDDHDDLSSPDDSEGKKKGDQESSCTSSPSPHGQQRRLSHSSRASSEVSRKHSSTPSTPRQLGRFKPPFLRRVTPGTSPAGIERTEIALGRSCSENYDRIQIELDSPPSSPGIPWRERSFQPTLQMEGSEGSGSPVHRIFIPAMSGEITFSESAPNSPSNSPIELDGKSLRKPNWSASKECTQLLEFLFVGGQCIAQDLDKLKANGITHIVNCAGDVCANSFEEHFTYLTLHLFDSVDEDLLSVLYGIIDFIENARINGGKVFVHCVQGASRSPSVTIGYLMALREDDFKSMADLVRQHRSLSRPNLNFSCQLVEWRRRVAGLAKERAFLYRIDAHSRRDSQLVGKWVDKVTNASLDERSVFVLHSYKLPKTYVFVGAACEKKELYCEAAKKVANWLHLYEHAPLEIEWIYSGQPPLSGNTADLFWEVIGPGPEGETGYVARSYNPDYDKDYGDSSSLPRLVNVAKDVEKEELSHDGDEFKLDDLAPLGTVDDLTPIGTVDDLTPTVAMDDLTIETPLSSASSVSSVCGSTTCSTPRAPRDSGTESQKRDSSISSDSLKDFKATLDTSVRDPIRLFEYPTFNVITCYDLSKLDSFKVFVRLLSHSASSTTSSTSSSVNWEQYYMRAPTPTSVYIHVWIGKNFVIPSPSTLAKASPTTSTPSSPSRSLELPVLSLPVFLSEHSTSTSVSSELEIATDGSPTLPDSPRETSSSNAFLFAEHVSHNFQKIIKLKQERTQFHTVLEEEGHESTAFTC